MTDDATRAQRLLSPLRERPHSVDSARAESRRARVVPELQRHLAAVAIRRKRMRWLRASAGAVAALSVAAAAVVYGVAHHAAALRTTEIRAVQGRLVHSVSGLDQTVLAGDRLAVPVDGELRTDEASGASLETENGLRLDLDVRSQVSLSHLSEAGERRVELLSGQVSCAVPKLEAGSSFSVVTPNARVVVHGTKFTVRVDSAEAGVTRTCVRVREGLVAVHQAQGIAMLHAGESWGCAEPPASNVPPRVTMSDAPPLSRTRRASHKSVLAVVTPEERAAREGTLGKEAELLQSALAAEHGGRREAAMAALTKLLSTYPESPLLPDARAALKRVAASDGSP